MEGGREVFSIQDCADAEIDPSIGDVSISELAVLHWLNGGEHPQREY